MRFTHQSRGRWLVADCDPDLQVQAETLLNLVAEANAQGDGLKDGSVIEFGWAPLSLRSEGRDLVLCEPDYEVSAKRFTPGVDRTLRVLAQQAQMLNSLGLEGVAARYNQGLVLKRGALQLPRVYLHRREPANAEDSGWYIGPADDLVPPDDAELDALHVYQLLDTRPALLKVMALPYNYLVVFDKDEIEAVLDEHGQAREISP